MKLKDAKYKKFTTKLQTQENKNQHTEKQSIWTINQKQTQEKWNELDARRE